MRIAHPTEWSATDRFSVQRTQIHDLLAVIIGTPALRWIEAISMTSAEFQEIRVIFVVDPAQHHMASLVVEREDHLGVALA